jgi:hypothetical protein
MIQHTSPDETIRVLAGAAFGRAQARQLQDRSRRTSLDESFEINVRNHKKEPVEVRGVEHLYRGNTGDSAQLQPRQPDHRVQNSAPAWRKPRAPSTTRGEVWEAHPAPPWDLHGRECSMGLRPTDGYEKRGAAPRSRHAGPGGPASTTTPPKTWN